MILIMLWIVIMMMLVRNENDLDNSFDNISKGDGVGDSHGGFLMVVEEIGGKLR